MSVTFVSDAASPRIRIREACLCAQMAPDFLRAAPEVLAAHAARSCTWCRGTGRAEREERGEPSLNVSNVNAHALLAFLRLIDDRIYLLCEVPSLGSATAGTKPQDAPYELSGQVELPRMRRALLQARNTFRTRSPYFIRPTEGAAHRATAE